MDINKLMEENYNEIRAKFKENYEKKTDKNFERFIKMSMVKIEWDFNKYKNNPLKYKAEIKTKYFKTKNEWCKHKNINNLKNKQLELYNITNKMGAGIFKSVFNVSGLNELLKDTDKNIRKWKDDTNSNLTEFPLFMFRGTKGIGDCFIRDILRLLIVKYETLLEETSSKPLEDLKPNLEVISNMRIINKIPEEYTCKENIYRNDSIKFKDNKITIGFNNIEANTFVDSELLDTLFGTKADRGIINDAESILVEASKKILAFNKEHRKLLQYVVSRKEEIFKKQEIVESLKNLTENVLGLENTRYNRSKTKNLLMGIAKTHYTINQEGVGSFFDIKFITNNLKQEFAVIYLSGMLSTAIKQNDFINVHKETFNKISEEAQNILLEFQEDRIQRILKKDYSLVRIMHIDEFNHLFRFSSLRTTKAKDKIITDALNELEKEQIVINKINRINKKLFEITYLEFSSENKSIILSKEFEIGNLIE